MSATVQARGIGRGETWPHQLDGLRQQWSHFSRAKGVSLKNQLQWPNLTPIPRLSRGRDTIRMTGKAGPTVLPHQWGWGCQPENPVIQAASDHPPSLWWLHNDRTMSSYRPICSVTNWHSTSTEGRGLDWIYARICQFFCRH